MMIGTVGPTALLLLLAGCVTGSGRNSNAAAFTAEVGRSPAAQIHATLPRILEKHGFRLRRTNQSPTQLYYETDWLRRELSVEEQAQGLAEATTRIVVVGRERSGLFILEMRADNNVAMLGASGWKLAAASVEFTRYIRRIAADLEAEYNTGVRRY